MVRYSAPHQDESHTPMEWTAIPDAGEDDNDDVVMSNSFSRFGLGESNSCRDFDASGGFVSYSSKRVNGNASGQEIICLCDSDSQDGAVDYSSHSDIRSDSPRMVPARDIYRCLQMMHDDEDHVHECRRRRRRRYTFFTTIIAFVAIVLYKYAPPPPPLMMNFSGKDSGMTPSMIWQFVGTSPSNSFETSKPTAHNMRQHDSWTSYCQDTLQMFIGASFHQFSVFWYALSNAFSYAAHEVTLAVVNFAIQSSPTVASKNGKANHQQHKQNAFTKTWCPIRVPAANNRHTSLPRGANVDTGINDDVNSFFGMSTEEFLRQSIGASLSPQNLALKLLAEGIDSWGLNLVEAASIPLVHRMSVATETGLWVHESNDDYTQQWILPPAMGMLFVGPEAVGKFHTARLLSHWLFGHCKRVDAKQTDESCATSSTEVNQQYCTEDLISNAAANSKTPTTPHELNVVLEIEATEYANNHNDESNDQDSAHRIKKSIIKHILEREHQGSVIILHHIEDIPLTLLSELSHVINGKFQELSYTNHVGSEISASTDGTIFVFTSKQWGTKNIFEEIQRNGMRTNGLCRDTLLSSVRREVDSHFQYWSKMANVSSCMEHMLLFIITC
jgi:hypothetical protein